MSTENAFLDCTLSQNDFDAFAHLSGDDNPIHVDPGFAAETRFGRTVAHGMLLYALLRGLIEQLIPGARQLTQELVFPAPAFADEPLRLEARITRRWDNRAKITIRAVLRKTDESVCEGTTVVELDREAAQ